MPNDENRKWSNEARVIIHWMIKELSIMKYFYKEIAQGCFRSAYVNYGMKKPVETEDEIVDYVIKTMKENLEEKEWLT